MSKKIGIIGAGAWGTALGKVLAEKGYFVEVWDYMEHVVEDINRRHVNGRYLVGVPLPESLRASSEMERVADGKEFVLFATPSLHLKAAAERVSRSPGIVKGRSTVGVLTKGFVPSDAGPVLPTQALELALPESYRGSLVYVSGPSHAEEVSRGKVTGLISASLNGKNSIRLREALGGSNLMVFSSFDVIGVQTCAAVKNVVAIAFGMLDALMELSDGFGDNTESLLLAAGLNEIQAIGQALGSTHPETFTSIAGVGDLDVTCRSRYGRNRKFGKEIVLDRILDRFRDLDDLIERIDSIGYLPEGAVAARHVQALSEKHGLRLTICGCVYRILNREFEPFDAIGRLLRNLPMEGMEGGTKESPGWLRRRSGA